MKWPLFVIIGVIITLVLVVYGVKMLDEEEEEDELRVLNLKPTLGVDNETELAQLTLKMIEGYLSWGYHQVALGGAGLEGKPVNEDGDRVTRSNDGDTAIWILSNGAGRFVVGNTYTVKIFVFQNSCIDFQKDIVAIAQDIPAPEG